MSCRKTSRYQKNLCNKIRSESDRKWEIEMKRLFKPASILLSLVLLISVLLICMAGCSQSNANTTIDIPDLMTKVEKTMKETNTCRTNVYLEINMKASASGSAAMTLVANMKSSIDSKNRLFSSVIETDLILPAGKKKMEQRIIAAGEKVYLKNNASSAQEANWQVKTLDQAATEKLWHEQSMQQTGLKFAEMLSPESFVYAGKEKANGRSCFALKQSLDPESLLNVSPELKQQLQNGKGLIPEELEKMLKSAEVVCLIDEQTYHLREFRLDAQINSQIAGKTITGTVKQFCRYDAFNEPVSVEVPADPK